MALEAKDVKTRLTYNPETGVLAWLPKPVRGGAFQRHDLAWNTNYAGKPTGSLNVHGYLVVNIDWRPHAAHRLAWAIVHGEWPREFLDHINGVKTDNRLCNLRQATAQQNCMNQDIRKDNRSGAKGVTWHPQTQKWRASIKIGGKRISLGLHWTVEDASDAYIEAAKEYFGEFACGGRS